MPPRPQTTSTARTPWFAIRVELVSGRGEELEPPPGRVMLASAQHTLDDLAYGINVAFGRWDLSHLTQFELPDGRVYQPFGDESDPGVVDSTTTTLGGVGFDVGSEFEFVFDLGDMWLHRCRVDEVNVDVVDEDGDAPEDPVPIWGWGSLPDQYGRVTSGDDGDAD